METRKHITLLKTKLFLLTLNFKPMTTKTKEIIELLEQGKTYHEIQTILQVSPTRISKIKKKYLSRDSESEEDDYDNTLVPEMIEDDDFDDTDSDSDSEFDSEADDSNTDFGSNYQSNDSKNSIYGSGFTNSGKRTMHSIGRYDQTGRNIFPHSQNPHSINEDSQYNRLLQQQKEHFEVMKHKYNLEHERKLMQMEDEREARIFQREQFLIKQENERKENRFKEKNFVKKFQKIFNHIEDGEWTYDELEDLTETIDSLGEAIENHCERNDIETENLRILNLLAKFKNEIEKALDIMGDDNDLISLRFSFDLHWAKKKAGDLSFSDYE
jgi:hypothetical protein